MSDLCGEQHAHALVVGREDALHSMEIIDSGGGLFVLAGCRDPESPASGAVEEKFASTELWVVGVVFKFALNKSSSS